MVVIHGLVAAPFQCGRSGIEIDPGRVVQAPVREDRVAIQHEREGFTCQISCEEAGTASSGRRNGFLWM